MKDLTVIVPIYYERAEVVEDIYHGLKELGCQVIIVDDGDTTPLKVPKVTYSEHRGYGYAIKTGIRHATTSTVCTADGDGQHNLNDIYKLWTVYQMATDCKMVVGTRWGLKESWFRKLGRKALNFLATVISGHYMVDLNSGLRVFDRQLALGYETILCDTFSFTTSLSMSMISDGYKTAWFPIEVSERVYGSSKVKVIQDGFITLYYIIRNGLAMRTRGLRKWLRRYTKSRWTSRATGAGVPTPHKDLVKDFQSYLKFSAHTKSKDSSL